MLLPRTKEWREARGLSQRELAAAAGAAERTVPRVEGGASVTPATARKLAAALGVTVSDLLESPPVPLAPAPSASPSPLDVAADEAGRTVADAVRSLMRRVAADYERELKDPDNPDFKTATAAARWATRVRREAKRYADWFIEEGSVLMARHAEASSPVFDTKVWVDASKIALPIYTLNELARRAEKRIEAMNDVPDELDQRRLEKVRREAEESERRVEELKAASG